MMRKITLVALALAAATTAASLGGAPASAQSAENLRQSARACELPTGYMRAIDNDARAAVDRINEQRRRVYEQKAREEGVEVAAVAQVYAQQLRSQSNYRAC